MEMHQTERLELAHRLLAALKVAQARRAIILGSQKLMGDRLLKAMLAKGGVIVLVPPVAEQAWIGECIDSEQRDGSCSAETRTRFRELMAEGVDHGVDTVVVMAPELTSLVASCGLDVRVLEVDATLSAC